MNRPRVVVVGAGFAGCAAAISAAKAGAEVILLERMDFVVASGIRAGRMNYNGKLVAAEEAKALGAGDMFEALESIKLHDTNIVDEVNGYVYNAIIVEPTVRRLVEGAGVDMRLVNRVTDVIREDGRLKAVKVGRKGAVEGDVFVDSSGNAGGIDICTRYGGGCAMCVTHRCPTFGDRVSIATKAGAPEFVRRRPDGTPGTIDAALSLHKTSLDPVLRARLERDGVVTIPLPPELIDTERLYRIGGIRSQRQMESLNVVDIGITAKCVGNGSILPSELRKIPGFENAIIDNPMGVGKGNRINWVSMARCEADLRVRGFANLFAAGQKAGPLGGIAEVIVTGVLAGHNAARAAAGKEPVTLPRSIAIGDFVAFVGEMMDVPGGLNRGYAFGHQAFFERLKKNGLYTTDVSAIHRRVKDAGMTGVLAKKVV
ncbi:MAG: FAD-dependent oxidoreductase [Dehalococcoidia bacterium]|nr:FAD-dependent oxidoreductase [Dehalococcoidia bacterium]